MNERDRLVKLIGRHCLARIDVLECTSEKDIECSGCLADHLIANNVTVPPVNVGQTVYIIRRPKGSLPWIAECVVSEVHVEYTADGKVCWFKGHNYEALEEDIGAWVFLVREEAEQALKERGEKE